MFLMNLKEELMNQEKNQIFYCQSQRSILKEMKLEKNWVLYNKADLEIWLVIFFMKLKEEIIIKPNNVLHITLLIMGVKEAQRAQISIMI